MKRDIAVVIGGTSYIAHQVLPKLNLEVNKIFFILRDGSKGAVPNTLNSYEVIRVEKFDSRAMQDVKLRIALSTETKLLILNFSGTLGNLFNSDYLDLNEFYETFQMNLEPFLQPMKLFLDSGSGSLYIAFSGAGIGGNSLDETSLGYLCAKGSIAFLVEVLQKKLWTEGKQICAIAPGAFPSRMQQILLDPKLKNRVESSRLGNIKTIFENGVSADKLISTLDFAIKNSHVVGGRVISANFDDLQKINRNENFGKLRRIVD